MHMAHLCDDYKILGAETAMLLYSQMIDNRVITFVYAISMTDCDLGLIVPMVGE